MDDNERQSQPTDYANSSRGLPQGREFSGEAVRLQGTAPPTPPPDAGKVAAFFGLEVLAWLGSLLLSALVIYLLIRIFGGLPIWPF